MGSMAQPRAQAQGSDWEELVAEILNEEMEEEQLHRVPSRASPLPPGTQRGAEALLRQAAMREQQAGRYAEEREQRHMLEIARLQRERDTVAKKLQQTATAMAQERERSAMKSQCLSSAMRPAAPSMCAMIIDGQRGPFHCIGVSS